ncbi:MAG: pilus assembly protein PilP [Pseudomonadales bacterium]|nr:pilus assembly protein PilP [Pseudomonadales bacterium]
MKVTGNSLATKFGVVCLPAVLMLSGCGGGDTSDLDAFMQAERQKPAVPIEPIPTFPQFDTFVYSAAGKRSPFEKPQALIEIEVKGDQVTGGAIVKPDELRPKEYLEQFNIGAITMVGTVEKDGEIWGLVDDGTANIHKVQVGNYMGRNHGKIYHIDNGRIDLKEIVPNGPDQWLERPKTLQLQESAEQ